MKDINFFESYLVKKKVTINKEFLFTLAGVTLFASILLYIAFNQVKIIKLSKDIDASINIVEDEVILEKIEEINKKENELIGLTKSIEQLRAYIQSMEEDNTINYSLLEMIASSIPSDVFLTSLSFYPEEINLIGKAKDGQLIAELIENLERFKPFKAVFLSSINKEGQFYSFTLDISLKEVINGGEDILNEEPEN